MRGTDVQTQLNWRRAALALVAAGATFAGVGLNADRAEAAYLSKIENGVLTIQGDAASDKLALRLKAGSTEKLLIDVGDNGSPDFSVKRDKFDTIVVNAGAGNDVVRIDESNGAFTGTDSTTLNGGDGNDTLQAGSSAETLSGGDGDDLLVGNEGNDGVRGGRGADVVVLGAGDDSFAWDPGDGSDVVEGQAGSDRLTFNGSAANETVDLAANGQRLRFFRDLAAITMDVDGVENVNFNALGGADTITVHDLTGTSVTKVALDLGGSAGDGQADNVIVEGTQAADVVEISRSTATPDPIVSGLSAVVTLGHSEADRDALAVRVESGADDVRVNETNGAIMPVFLDGGAGDDTLAGGSAPDTLLGVDGNDTLLGKGGSDTISGGDGNDTITGGPGDETALLGGAGDDSFVWNPGEGSDVLEGGVGRDHLQVNGGNGAESFTVLLSGTRIRVDRVTPAPFFQSAGSVEAVEVHGNGGDDTIGAGAGLAGIVELLLDGGAGNDTISGGDGNDLLLGGDGNDSADGNRGNDVVFLGEGDDASAWDPGDGSDVVEGQAGADSLLFNGSGASETFDVSADGARVRLFRDVGSITMDLDGIERIAVEALGGADKAVVNDLSGTDLKNTELDLEGTVGGGAGDGQRDTTFVNGTNANDGVNIAASAGVVEVTGLATTTKIEHSEPANDSLVVEAHSGDDTINAGTGLALLVMKLTVDGAAGNDSIGGGDGADVLIAGDGDDAIDGNRGDDIAFLGAGNDTFSWDPGDGSDVVEGEAGADSLLFNGSAAAENFDVAANGSRVRFFRNVAAITMDLNDIERIAVEALGGADRAVVNDLSGTDLTEADFDLEGTVNGGDGAADSISVTGTNGDDVILAAGDSNGVSVIGLAARVNITHAEAGNDSLTLNALAGDDVIEASGLASGSIALTTDAGAGDDVLIGGSGNDILFGGDGDDVLIGGPGQDLLDGGPGANILIQD